MAQSDLTPKRKLDLIYQYVARERQRRRITPTEYDTRSIEPSCIGFGEGEVFLENLIHYTNAWRELSGPDANERIELAYRATIARETGAQKQETPA